MLVCVLVYGGLACVCPGICLVWCVCVLVYLGLACVCPWFGVFVSWYIFGLAWYIFGLTCLCPGNFSFYTRYGYLMVFLWLSMVCYGYPMVIIWLSYGYPMCCYGYPMVIIWLSYGDQCGIWLSYGYHMVILWLSGAQPTYYRASTQLLQGPT